MKILTLEFQRFALQPFESDHMTPAAVKHYWEERVHDWGVTASAPGTLAFFQELEGYRFRKLRYLDESLQWLVAVPRPTTSILDVGCGAGTELARMSRYCDTPELFGIDLTERAVNLAHQNFKVRDLGGDFQIMDGEEMTFADNTFDAVFCHSTLQFAPDPGRMISEIYRVLKPGGRAVLMVINKFSWLNSISCLPGLRVDFHDAPCFHHHTMQQFQDLVSSFTAEPTFERLPVHSEALSGLKGLVFNHLFLPCFHLLPTRLTRSLGHHLVARCEKP